MCISLLKGGLCFEIINVYCKEGEPKRGWNVILTSLNISNNKYRKKWNRFVWIRPLFILILILILNLIINLVVVKRGKTSGDKFYKEHREFFSSLYLLKQTAKTFIKNFLVTSLFELFSKKILKYGSIVQSMFFRMGGFFKSNDIFLRTIIYYHR